MHVAPQTPAEKIVWYTLIWTWPFYGFGALYVVGPVLGWMLAAMAGLSLYLGPAIRSDMRATGPVPALVWVWSVGMLVMLIALWAGHADWNLGATKTIKSSIGWAKGWALIPLFILAGAVLPIRREVLVRGECVLGLWTLCLLPLLSCRSLMPVCRILLFTSPLKAVGGPGPEYFSVYLYTIDPASGTPRWQFFAPWSPFAALLGVCMVLFALEEKHRTLEVPSALAAGVLMILMSKSRLGLVGLVVCSLSPPPLATCRPQLGLGAIVYCHHSHSRLGRQSLSSSATEPSTASNPRAPIVPAYAKRCSALRMSAGNRMRWFSGTARSDQERILLSTCRSAAITPGTDCCS